jgi:flagellar biosynthetic protein FliQ
MSPELPVTLAREGLMLLASVGGPLFGVLLLVGFAVGVLQATTQINDPAVSFLPRVAAALLVCWAFGGWMVERLAAFLSAAMERMAAHPF